MKLSMNSLEVLKKRYLRKDDHQNVVETPEGLFRRVAYNIAKAERLYRSRIKAEEAEERFYGMMHDLDFLPNSPTLMNAGTSIGQLSACFVIPVEDSIGRIFDALKNMAVIHQTGGGTGFSFSNLRPKDDLVYSTKGAASGPVSFMRIFDTATGVIVQGGRRRGANMGILRVDHPDILEFIKAKREKNAFSNFNLSVGATDSFMKAVNSDARYDLVNPRTKKSVAKVLARAVFDAIVDAAWHTGDPGLVFLDEINRTNPTPYIGKIAATNPCGELPLLPYESCNLGSINLSNMVSGKSPDLERLKGSIGWAVRFLDDVIEVNRFPSPKIKKATFDNRKIGLGVMGFADMLIKLGITYGSKRSLDFADRLMNFVHRQSVSASEDLAKERGVFPNFKKSIYLKRRMRLRNATVNTVAPTGTISIIAGCSSGIEPIFAVSFTRNVLSGKRLFETNPLFEKLARDRDIYTQELVSKVAHHGSLKNLKGIPKDLAEIFITAFDVPSMQHLAMQAVFQKHTDNSVSKTINLPEDATRNDIRRIYLAAHKLRLKGITVYRYGSKDNQVLSIGGPSGSVTAGSEYSGGCASGTCHF